MFSRYAINPQEAMRRAAQQVDAYVTDRLRENSVLRPETVQHEEGD
jgi:hypothetical protein